MFEKSSSNAHFSLLNNFYFDFERENIFDII